MLYVRILESIACTVLPRQIFDRQNSHGGGHIPSVPQLPTPCSIFQIPGKTLVLAVLPPVAALMHVYLHGPLGLRLT